MKKIVNILFVLVLLINTYYFYIPVAESVGTVCEISDFIVDNDNKIARFNWGYQSETDDDYQDMYIDFGDGSNRVFVGKVNGTTQLFVGVYQHTFPAYQSYDVEFMHGSDCSRIVTVEFFPPSSPTCNDSSADNFGGPAPCQWGMVNLNFVATDVCTGAGIPGVNVNINQDFGNGTSRTTDGNGFANFGAYKNRSVGYTFSLSGYSSASGSIDTGDYGATANAGLTPTGGCSGGGSGIIPQPTNLVVSCPAPGTTATATWNAPAGYDTFYIRIAPGANNATPPWTVYDDNYVGTSLNFSTVAGQTYHVRVYTKNTTTGASSSYTGTNVTCTASATSDDAQFISQSGLYSTMVTGRTYPVNIVMKNTGGTTWSSTYQYRLGAQNPSNNTNFYALPGQNLPSSPIAPNSNANFGFNILIPSTPGTYHFQNQMKHDLANGSIPAGSFGEMTPDTLIRAVSTPGAIASQTATCNATGDQVNLSWGVSSGATNYLLRLDPAPVGTTGNCGAGNTTLCVDYYAGTNYTASVVPGQSYTTWVLGNVCDDYTTNSGCYGAQASTSFTCSAPAPYSLTVTKVGRGNVSSADNLISCGADCTENYSKNSSVTLTAVPASSYWKFTGWFGDCSGLGACVLLMSGPKMVQARFERRTFNYFEF